MHLYFDLDFSMPVSISVSIVIWGYGLNNMPPVMSLQYHQRTLNSRIYEVQND